MKNILHPKLQIRSNFVCSQQKKKRKKKEGTSFVKTRGSENRLTTT